MSKHVRDLLIFGPGVALIICLFDPGLSVYWLAGCAIGGSVGFLGSLILDFFSKGEK